MDAKQERLLNYIRELHLRDQRGPSDFLICEPEELRMRLGGRFPSLQAELTGSSLAALKKADRLEGWLEGSGMLPDLAMPDLGPEAVPSAAPGSAAPPTELSITREAADAYHRALSGRSVSEADLAVLESIVLPALRPVFDIRNGSYETLPSAWDELNLKRASFEPLIRGIGRLQLTGHPSYTLVGTGFVCGPHAILTNRHVAQIFVQGIESGQILGFLPGVNCAMEMCAEVGSANTLQLDLSRPLAVSDVWDAALLRVEQLPQGVVPLPLARQAPVELEGSVATIVGYPSYDPRESFIDQANIFRSVFDRKRLQPGKLNGQAEATFFGRRSSVLAHDCSTLGGNSGSALISALSAQVVGLHFCGVTHVSNYAVPTWELAGDPAFQGEALNFV